MQSVVLLQHPAGGGQDAVAEPGQVGDPGARDRLDAGERLADVWARPEYVEFRRTKNASSGEPTEGDLPKSEKTPQSAYPPTMGNTCQQQKLDTTTVGRYPG